MLFKFGEVSERLKEHAWKACVLARVPWVRIPPSPPVGKIMEKEILNAIKITGEIIDLWMPLKIKFAGTPGVSVGISYKGQLLYKKGFGLRDVEKGFKADASTAYHIASISKMFTAVAILQLKDRKKLSLDDNVIKHLPWFRVKNEVGDTDEITIRELLNHSSGLARDGAGTTMHWSEKDFPNTDELKLKFGNQFIINKHGTMFKYSNFNFVLLGLVVESVSGLSYEEFIKENIIEALGLKNTTTDYKEGFNNYAKGYFFDILEDKILDLGSVRTRAYGSATGFISNTIDLNRFLNDLNPNNEGVLLSKESKKEMTDGGWPTGKKNEYYGFASRLSLIEGRKVMGHGGVFYGYKNRINLDIENEIGVFVLANGESFPAVDVNAGIFKMMYYLLDKKGEYKENEERGISDSNYYNGLFSYGRGYDIIVRAGNSFLAINPSSSDPTGGISVLNPVSENEFLVTTKDNFANPGEKVKFFWDKR